MPQTCNPTTLFALTAAALLLRKSEALRAKLQEQREEGGRLAGERESLRGGA